MKVLRSIGFNLFSFLVGIVLAGGLVFLLGQSGLMTASVYDALDTKFTVAQSDISFSVDAGAVVVKTERLFPSLQEQSFHIQMLYNDQIDTKDWKVRSDLKHSFEIHDGIVSIVLDLDGVRLAGGQEIFRLVMKPELTDTILYPQFESIVRYGNNLTEELVAKRLSL